MDFGEGEEAVAVAAVVDEGRLERRLDARDLGEIDVASQLLAVGSLEIEFLDAIAAHDDHPGLFRVGRVDEHLVGHAGSLWPAGSREQCRSHAGRSARWHADLARRDAGFSRVKNKEWRGSARWHPDEQLPAERRGRAGRQRNRRLGDAASVHHSITGSGSRQLRDDALRRQCLTISSSERSRPPEPYGPEHHP